MFILYSQLYVLNVPLLINFPKAENCVNYVSTLVKSMYCKLNLINENLDIINDFCL